MQVNLFHNTSNLAGADLERAKRQTKSQNQRVLAFFRTYPGAAFPPSEVHKKMVSMQLINWRTPIQSIRRALSTLTKSGHLIKTRNQKPGAFGKRHPEYCWMLADAAE
ncbi:hypothetical protein [Larkinella arboricola]